MKLALGVNSFDEFADRIRVFMDLKSPQGFLDKLKMLPLLTEAGKFFPKTVPTGPCKEVIKRDNFSILDFPILQCWPQDAGRFITLPCVITRDPNSGKRNVGMYRLQVYDATTTGRALAAAEGGRRTLPQAGAPALCEGGDFDLRRLETVDLMARTSGGQVLSEANHPSGRMEVAVAIGTDPAVTFPPSSPLLPTSKNT
jgi:4-hydroxy-3-polyprenylbenzoate decarboxylase